MYRERSKKNFMRFEVQIIHPKMIIGLSASITFEIVNYREYALGL